MSRYWNDLLSELTPYIPGEQPIDADTIKLNTNELPYLPSPKAREAMQAACEASMNLYPDPESRDLRAAIARHEGCAPENIFVGNGSDEVLGHAFRALIANGGKVAFADITYGFYPVYCRLFGLQYIEVPLSETFKICVEDYFNQPSNAIVIANPNANTGIALSREDLERLLQARTDCVVIIDEAYVDFGAESVAPLIDSFKNLLVVQTLSKSRGLAGLRVGFAIGHSELIAGLTRVKNSFNSYPLSRIAQAGAQAAIEDTTWLRATVHKVQFARAELSLELTKRGFEVLPSQANFIAVRHYAMTAEQLCSALRTQKILVRHLSTKRIQDWIRITIGTPLQHEKLLEAIDRIFA